jgi:hypothetical protein
VRLVYLSGEPGAGKSTLMRELTRRYERIPLLAVHGAPARDALVDVDAPPPLSYGEPQRWAAVELGKRRAAFSGTDALPQAVITDAEAYLRDGVAAEETSLLLAEGARLANERFLTAALTSGWAVTLVHLDPRGAGEERRAKRAAELGKPPQNASWVKGRITAARNLTLTAPARGAEVLLLDSSTATPSALAAAVRLGVPELR